MIIISVPKIVYNHQQAKCFSASFITKASPALEVASCDGMDDNDGCDI